MAGDVYQYDVLWAVSSGGSLPPLYFAFARSEEAARDVFGPFSKGHRLEVVTRLKAAQWGLYGYAERGASNEPIMGTFVFQVGDKHGVLLV